MMGGGLLAGGLLGASLADGQHDAYMDVSASPAEHGLSL
jgi:hypothetical protein